VGEIAFMLGRAPGTITKQIQRGLEKLAAKLPRELSAFGVRAVPRPDRSAWRCRAGAVAREHRRGHAPTEEVRAAASAALEAVRSR
jgi:hypothetical protein